MDLLDAHLVHRRFRFTEPLKNRRRVGLGPRRKRGLVDHLEDVPQVPVLRGFRDLHMKFERADPAAFDGLNDTSAPASSEWMASAIAEWSAPGMSQASDQHVAAKSRKCVQITKFHESRL